MYFKLVAIVKTRHSVEHCTLHADGTPLHFTGLSLNDKVLPITYILAECGRGSIPLQSIK